MVDVSRIDEIAIQIATLTLEKRDKEAEVKEINKKILEAESKLIPILLEEGREKWDIPELGSVSLRASTNWNIEDQGKLLEYLRDNEPGLIKMHPMFIKGWATEKLAEGNWDCEAIGLKPYEQIKTSFRRK
jgi:hypothetical protein